MKRVRTKYLIAPISNFLIKTSLNRFDRKGNEPLAKQSGDTERSKSVMQSFEHHVFMCVCVSMPSALVLFIKVKLVLANGTAEGDRRLVNVRVLITLAIPLLSLRLARHFVSLNSHHYLR